MDLDGLGWNRDWNGIVAVSFSHSHKTMYPRACFSFIFFSGWVWLDLGWVLEWGWDNDLGMASG